MASVDSNGLWEIIQSFVSNARKIKAGYVTQGYNLYRGLLLSGNYASHNFPDTSWLALCARNRGQSIADGIYVALYINRSRRADGSGYDLNSMELCYARSEKKPPSPARDWGAACGTERSESPCYRTSFCPDRYEDLSPRAMESLKEEILGNIDAMVGVYMRRLDEIEAASRACVVEEIVEAPDTAPSDVVPAADEEELPEPDEEQRALINYIEHTRHNIFIQGKAGTGKSTLIKHLKRDSAKSLILTAPTGIAANNISGSTLHSLFLLKPLDFFEEGDVTVGAQLRDLLEATELMVIDEISMVRPDMLDAIDLMARKARSSEQPFGGIQMVLIGDICQLPPVIKEANHQKFRERYEVADGADELPFFFDSAAYREGGFKMFQLTRVHRQSADPEFARHLEQVRLFGLGASLSREQLACYFNRRSTLHGDGIVIPEEVITITPRNAEVQDINEEKQAALTTPKYTYRAKRTGVYADDFRASDGRKRDTDYPAEVELTLRQGDRVIFNKNNKAGGWVNGSTGTVANLDRFEVQVRLDEGGRIVSVPREVWQSLRYEVVTRDGKKMTREEAQGSFTQYPLHLAYARTVHKVQGVTLDKVIIKPHLGMRNPGQLYVALSRARTLAGVYIDGEIRESDIRTSPRVIAFLRRTKGCEDFGDEELVLLGGQLQPCCRH